MNAQKKDTFFICMVVAIGFIIFLGLMNHLDSKEQVEKPIAARSYVEQIILHGRGKYTVFVSSKPPTDPQRDLVKWNLEEGDMLNDLRGFVADVPKGEPMWVEYYKVGHFVANAVIHVRSGQDIVAGGMK